MALSSRGQDLHEVVCSGCNDDALNADELEIVFGNAFYLKAQLDGLACAAVEFVQRLRLSVAARKSRDRGNIKAFLVLLDDHVKNTFHGEPPS
jgi:hypothetical protein